MPATASQSFPLLPSHSDELRCPKCDQPLRRLTGAQGSFILTCPNRIKDAERVGRSDHCGQKLHVFSMEGVAIVLPLSRELFDRFQKAYPGAAVIYETAGLIPTRPGAEYVPSYPCRVCKTPTKLYELHGGKCSSCTERLEAASVPE